MGMQESCLIIPVEKGKDRFFSALLSGEFKNNVVVTRGQVQMETQKRTAIVFKVHDLGKTVNYIRADRKRVTEAAASSVTSSRATFIRLRILSRRCFNSASLRLQMIGISALNSILRQTAP